jgi:phenylalanyl-tRNA synthetase alpha chain
LDWKHLFEFHQVDGIVIDPDANVKHLKAYLRQFFGKMGYPKIRIRPAYFPYTEPSLEVEVWHPKKQQWIELGGAGIFRPEVVVPLLGHDVPVLAWGLGLERIISEYYRLTDIRDLYKNDIKQLQNMKLWVK